jgi:hypothetical protein
MNTSDWLPGFDFLKSLNRVKNIPGQQSMLKDVLAVFHQLFETSKRFSITVRIRKDNLLKISY